MSLKFDPNVHYECVQCGRGCFNAWDINVEPGVVEALKGHPLELRVIQERGAAFCVSDGQAKINKDADHPRCGFLQEDLLCSIHKELGYEAKPLTCQQYPFLLTQTPDGEIQVSAAYSCTAVREDIGPDLEESRASVEDLLRRGGRVHRLPTQIEVLPPLWVDYKEIVAFEAEFLDRLSRASWDALLEDTLMALARNLAALNPDPARGGPLPEDFLAGSWNTPVAPESLRASLGLIHMVVTMGLLKPCLFSTDREVWKKIDQAMLGDGDLQLPDFNWNAPLGDLQLWVNQSVGSQFDARIQKFQRSLFFRKAHLTMGGLLPGLLLIWVKPAMIRLLTGLYAWKHEREPLEEDFLWALERAETRLVGHTFDTIPVYRQAAWQLVGLSA